jgi:hypothetical protein
MARLRHFAVRVGDLESSAKPDGHRSKLRVTFSRMSSVGWPIGFMGSVVQARGKVGGASAVAAKAGRSGGARPVGLSSLKIDP